MKNFIVSSENAATVKRVAYEAEKQSSDYVHLDDHFNINESCCARFYVDGTWSRAVVKHVDNNFEVSFIII